MEKTKVTTNKKKPKGYWNEPRITERARRFGNLKEWRMDDYPSYNAAVKKGLTRKIAQEMGWHIGVPLMWTYQFARRRAQKYKTITEWRNDDIYSYDAACRHGYLPRLKKELGIKSSIQFNRTYDEVLKIASDFVSVRDWQKHSAKTYQQALKAGWKDSICEKLNFKYKPSGRDSNAKTNK